MKFKGSLCFLMCLVLFNACNRSDASQKKKEQTNHIITLLIPATVHTYSWLNNYDIKNAIVNRIPVPDGFKRVEVKDGSFADWLRFLPLKPGNPDVHLYNGELKKYQSGHSAVVNIDVGTADLQQCADAVIRMRAEYLYAQKEFDALHFNFTSGNTIGFKKWSEGYRTIIKGNNVTWVKTAMQDSSYKTFKEYLTAIFNYAGTSSLSKELKPVNDLNEIRPGDVFIAGGFPGHAVLVIDVCEKKDTGEKLFMIQQSYMPAQEIHILKNFNNAAISPWYSTRFEGELKTPEWTFTKTQLLRWQ